MTRSCSFGGGRIQELLGVMLARMQPREVGDTVMAADHRLAVDEEAGYRQPARRVQDARVALAPSVFESFGCDALGGQDALCWIHLRSSVTNDEGARER
jgi:hypothetical protein